MLDDVDIILYGKRDIYIKKSKEFRLNTNEDTLVLTDREDIRALQLSTLNFFYTYKLSFGRLPIATPWGKLFKARLLQEHCCRFVEGYGEDRPCMIKAYYYAKKIIYINAVLHNYYLHESSMRKYLSDAPNKYRLSMMVMNQFVYEHYQDDSEFAEQVRHFNIAWFSYFVMQDFVHRDNPQTYENRKSIFMTRINESPYWSSFNEANLSGLPLRRRILAYLIKWKNFALIEILAKGNYLYNKIMKWN
jgi:hypothetical protein